MKILNSLVFIRHFTSRSTEHFFANILLMMNLSTRFDWQMASAMEICETTLKAEKRTQAKCIIKAAAT